VASSAAVSERMSKHPRRDTLPEVRLRQALHARGLRFRVQQPVPGIARRTIDIAFTRAKVAVFVDGCFWHGCAEHRRIPRSNSAWWAAKIHRNRERDEETDVALAAASWVVVRVWEHDTLDDAAARVQRVVAERV